MQKICVTGLGYVGLPTASMFATHGFKVVGVDTNPEVVKNLAEGEVHIEEPGLRAFFRDAISDGKLVIKSEIEDSNVFIICVPTPLKKEKRADLSYVAKATRAIVPHLNPENLVILESTVPPGTTKNMLGPLLEKSGLKTGKDFHLAYCPENVLPGNILKEMIENYRVVGGVDEKSSKKAKKLYQSFVKGKIYTTDPTTAECVKLLENTYRDVNIALANELLRMMGKLGVNVWRAIALANHHPRVNIHLPGPGVGGHCIPIDPWFIYEKAPKIAELIRFARRINESMPQYVLEQIGGLLKGVSKPKITIFGVAYKGNIDDTRGSPALSVIKLAKRGGFRVAVCDPHVKKFEYKISSVEDGVKGSSCIVVLTDHEEFKTCEPRPISRLMRNKNILDTKNIIEKKKWKSAGFKVKVMGG